MLTVSLLNIQITFAHNSIDRKKASIYSTQCSDVLNNAHKVVASPDKNYIYILQKNTVNNSSELIVLSRSPDFKKFAAIKTANTLDIAIAPDSKAIFLLTDTGKIIAYNLDKNRRKLILKHESRTLEAKSHFTKGVLTTSKNGKYLYATLRNKTDALLKGYNNKLDLIQTISSKNNQILNGAIDATIEDDHLFVYSWDEMNIGAFKVNTNGRLSFQRFSAHRGFRHALKQLSTSRKKMYLAKIATQQYNIKNPLSVKKDGSLSNIAKSNIASGGAIWFSYPYNNNKNLISINTNTITVNTVKANNIKVKTSINIQQELKSKLKDVIVLQNKIYLLSATRLCIYIIDSKTEKSTLANKTKLPINASKPVTTRKSNISNTQKKPKKLSVKIQNDDMPKMVLSIASGHNIQQPDAYGASPLMLAFYLNQKEMVKSLISRGARLNNKGVIYRDRNFETYYGNILSICLERDFELLKYAVEDLKTPWDDQQFDLFTNQKSGHVALSSFMLNKLDVQTLLPYNDPELKEEVLNNPRHQIRFNDGIISERLKQMELTEHDEININYLIKNIPDNKVRNIYKNLMQYIKARNANILSKVINELKKQNAPYLKLLLIDLLALKQDTRKGEIADYEKIVALSKTYYGEFHPKTTNYIFNLSQVYISNNSYTKNSEKNLDKAELLLWKCLRNRITRYGAYHSLTIQVLNELSRTVFLKVKNQATNRSNQYSRLASKINEKLEGANYGGSNYNKLSAFEYQSLNRIGVNTNSFIFHSNYYNKRLKSLFDRIQSYFPENKQQSWSKYAPQKKFFDIDFMIDYLNENFDLIKSRLALKDSNTFITEITNAYNAIYSYRKDVLNDNNYKTPIPNLDTRLLNLQLRIKGANLSPNKEEIKFNTLKKLLSEEEAVIEIVRYNEFVFPEHTNSYGYSDDLKINYIAFIVKKDSKNPIMISLPIAKSDEDTFIEKFNFNSSNQKSIISFTKEKQTFKKIFKPLMPYIKGKKRVYLCADGIYHQFPFDLLQDENKKNITDNIEIIRVMNSGNIAKLKQQASKSNLRLSAVLIGNPDFSLSNTCNMPSYKTPRLPETATEVNHISALLKSKNWQVSTFLGKQAEEGIVKKINAPTILHIATHGNYLNKNITNPFDSFKNHYLKLAGCDCNNQNKDNDGLLNGLEIQQINLKNTQLVVLAACKTGRGSTVNAEGILGLSKAFQMAGAESTISTLWKINSEITLEFITYFYDNFTETNDRFLAFRYAKNKLKQSWGNSFSSGYILVN